jgi:hypothetical protein
MAAEASGANISPQLIDETAYKGGWLGRAGVDRGGLMDLRMKRLPEAAGRGSTRTGDAVTVVLTVGHGARSAEELLAILQDANVTTLIDIRRFPGSRRHPQFGREALAASLGAAGIRYEWQGEQLGGRRDRHASSRHTALVNAAFGGYADHMDTPAFRTAVQSLVARAEAGERLALMCAETLWWRCHRSLVADALVCRGIEVVHLLDLTRREPHRRRPTMRCGDDGGPVYDVADSRTTCRSVASLFQPVGQSRQPLLCEAL